MSTEHLAEVMAQSAQMAMEGYTPTSPPEPEPEPAEDPVKQAQAMSPPEAPAVPRHAYHFKGVNRFGVPVAGTVITDSPTAKSAREEMEKGFLWKLETVEGLTMHEDI